MQITCVYFSGEEIRITLTHIEGEFTETRFNATLALGVGPRTTNSYTNLRNLSAKVWKKLIWQLGVIDKHDSLASFTNTHVSHHAEVRTLRRIFEAFCLNNMPSMEQKGLETVRSHTSYNYDWELRISKNYTLYLTPLVVGQFRRKCSKIFLLWLLYLE